MGSIFISPPRVNIPQGRVPTSTSHLGQPTPQGSDTRGPLQVWPSHPTAWAHAGRYRVCSRWFIAQADGTHSGTEGFQTRTPLVSMLPSMQFSYTRAAVQRQHYEHLDARQGFGDSNPRPTGSKPSRRLRLRGGRPLFWPSAATSRPQAAGRHPVEISQTKLGDVLRHTLPLRRCHFHLWPEQP